MRSWTRRGQSRSAAPRPQPHTSKGAVQHPGHQQRVARDAAAPRREAVAAVRRYARRRQGQQPTATGKHWVKMGHSLAFRPLPAPWQTCLHLTCVQVAAHTGTFPEPLMASALTDKLTRLVKRCAARPASPNPTSGHAARGAHGAAGGRRCPARGARLHRPRQEKALGRRCWACSSRGKRWSASSTASWPPPWARRGRHQPGRPAARRDPDGRPAGRR